MKKLSTYLLAGLWISVTLACQDQQKTAQNQALKTYVSPALGIGFSYPDTWEVRENGSRLSVFEALEDSTDNFQENILMWYEDMPMKISDSLFAKAAVAEIMIKNPNLQVSNPKTIQLGKHMYYTFEFDFINTDSATYHIYGYTLVKDSTGYNFSCTADADKASAHKSGFETILSTFIPK
jgi:hypothetical protein